jgi:hypothetical protein
MERPGRSTAKETMDRLIHFIESNYPLASDVAKRRARFLYLQLLNQTDLASSDVPALAGRYETAIDDLRLSHEAKTNELMEMAWTIERERRVA